jgi:hypothetical protein
VLFYFGLMLSTFVVSWLGLTLIEPDAVWTDAGLSIQEKLIDCASGVGATLNGVGPGLGTIGATKNYAHFQPASKFLLTVRLPCDYCGNHRPTPRRSPPPCKTSRTMEIARPASSIVFDRWPGGNNRLECLWI